MITQLVQSAVLTVRAFSFLNVQRNTNPILQCGSEFIWLKMKDQTRDWRCWNWGNVRNQALDWGNVRESKRAFSRFEIWLPRRSEKAASSSASWMLCCVYWLISRFFISSTVSLKILLSVIFSPVICSN